MFAEGTTGRKQEIDLLIAAFSYILEFKSILLSVEMVLLKVWFD